MNTPGFRRIVASGCIWLVALLLIAGCSGAFVAQPKPLVGLAPSEILQAPHNPLVLWRPLPGFGVSARDFLYIAPLDTNISGDRQLYLWFGFASSVDQTARPKPFSSTRQVSLRVDEEVFFFELEPFEFADQSAFSTRLTPLATYRGRVSQTQLEQLAAASKIAVAIDSTRQNDPSFERWSGGTTGWASFANENKIQIKAAAHHAPLHQPDN